MISFDLHYHNKIMFLMFANVSQMLMNAAKTQTFVSTAASTLLVAILVPVMQDSN